MDWRWGIGNQLRRNSSKAVIQTEPKNQSNILSQMTFIENMEGVVPENASRKHIEAVFPVINEGDWERDRGNLK